MAPEVSVVIPTYNSAGTVLRALDSVLGQTYQNIEIIVVDDGSTDDTAVVVSSYLDHITYIWQENRGRSAARNRGIAAARGNYIAFLDADDWWLPRKLARQVAMLDVNPAVGLVHTARNVIEPDGGVEPMAPKQREDDPGSQMFAQLILHQASAGSPSFVMVRKTVLDDVGGFDESLHGSEDWDLWLRISSKYLVAYVAEPLACYQMHAGSQVSRIVARNVQVDWYRILDNLFVHPTINKRYGGLEPLARARVLVYDALIDCAFSKRASGAEKLGRAVQSDRSLFTPPVHELGNWVIEFANMVYPGKPQPSLSLEFVDRFWSMLPASLETDLREERNRVKGNLCAGRFFKAYKCHQWDTVRSSAWRAVLFQPAWMRNRGFRSIWIRSLLAPLALLPTRTESSPESDIAASH